jgi:hypothetical protein
MMTDAHPTPAPGPYARAAHIYWAAVDTSAGPDACWPWTLGRSNGYGRLSLGASRYIYAHRLAVILAGRDLPDGLVVDHLCGNRSCVNERHLEVVTNRQNILRGTRPAARAAEAAVCLRGHPFDTANTDIRPDGSRRCRTCHRNAARAAYAANPDVFRERSRINYQRRVM